MTTRLNFLHLLALILFLFMGVSIMGAEQLRVFNGHLQQALADVEVAKQQIRQQLDALREKENERQQALSRADAAASAEAQMTAEQLRVLSGLLRDALADAEAAKSRVSKLLAEVEHAKERLAASLAEAESAKKEAEKAWAIERQRRALLEAEMGDSKEDLQ
jgi:predicted  nucleic acid-binding Zn-ribbon protein